MGTFQRLGGFGPRRSPRRRSEFFLNSVANSVVQPRSFAQPLRVVQPLVVQPLSVVWPLVAQRFGSPFDRGTITLKQIAICEKRRPIAIAFPLKLSHAYYHPRKVVVHAHRHIYFMGLKRLYVTVWLKLLDLAVRFKFDFHKLQLSWIMFTILWLRRR